jgi:hypothetical protein
MDDGTYSTPLVRRDSSTLEASTTAYTLCDEESEYMIR